MRNLYNFLCVLIISSIIVFGIVGIREYFRFIDLDKIIFSVREREAFDSCVKVCKDDYRNICKIDYRHAIFTFTNAGLKTNMGIVACYCSEPAIKCFDGFCENVDNCLYSGTYYRNEP
jgi:hypothetical protein